MPCVLGHFSRLPTMPCLLGSSSGFPCLTVHAGTFFTFSRHAVRAATFFLFSHHPVCAGTFFTFSHHAVRVGVFFRLFLPYCACWDVMFSNILCVLGCFSRFPTMPCTLGRSSGFSCHPVHAGIFSMFSHHAVRAGTFFSFSHYAVCAGSFFVFSHHAMHAGAFFMCSCHVACAVKFSGSSSTAVFPPLRWVITYTVSLSCGPRSASLAPSEFPLQVLFFGLFVSTHLFHICGLRGLRFWPFSPLRSALASRAHPLCGMLCFQPAGSHVSARGSSFRPCVPGPLHPCLMEPLQAARPTPPICLLYPFLQCWFPSLLSV